MGLCCVDMFKCGVEGTWCRLVLYIIHIIYFVDMVTQCMNVLM